MANTIFPLLRLPETPRHHVLKSMNYIELTSYSLLSRKAKSLIKSLKIQASKILVNFRESSLILHVWIQDLDDFEITMFEIENLNSESLKLNVEQPCKEVSVCIYPDLSPESQKMKTPPLSIERWIQHLSLIFNCCEPPHLNFNSELEVFDTRSIRKAIPEISGLTIGTLEAYGRKILQLFLSDSRCGELRLECDPFVNEPPVTFQRVGIQNLNDVEFCCSKIVLNHLLTFNFHYINICQDAYVSIKDINSFIKSWIKGSNPKLKWIRSALNEASNEETVLKGILYEVVPETTERPFRHKGSEIISFIKGGFDVRNKKGITANIQMINFEGLGSILHIYILE